MAVARHADVIEVQDEDQDDTNHENDTAVATRRTNVQMSEEGHYESLDLQKIDEAVYGDLRTKAKKGKGQPKRSATNHKNDTAVTPRRTNVQMSEEGHYERLDLQKIDNAVYGDLRTKAKKGKGLPKQSATNHKNETAVTARRTIAKMSEEGHYESLDLQKIDEAVYGDLRTKTRKRKGQPKTRQSGPLRVVAWCLGILCFILLGVIIMGLAVHFNNTERNMTYYNNLTMQITHLKNDYKNVTMQITQLKYDYNNLSLQNVLLKDEVIQLKSEAAATTTPPTTTVSDRKAVIMNVKMSEDMQRDAVQFATQAQEKYNDNYYDIAVYIKKEFDKKYNRYWHCIVGRNCGSYVHYQGIHYISFYMGQVRIVLYKTRN